MASSYIRKLKGRLVKKRGKKPREGVVDKISITSQNVLSVTRK